MKCYFAGLILFAAVPAFSAGDITVTPTQISENRSAALVKSEDDSFGFMSGVTVKLHIDGPGVKDASSYGKIEIAEAVDDTGKDLKPEEDSFFTGSSDFVPTDYMQFDMDGEEKKTGFDIELKLQPSSRSAKSLKSVKGQFQVLAGGEKKKVSAGKLASMLGKPLDDPALKEAGVEIAFVDPKKTENPFFGASGADENSFSVLVKGNFDAVGDIEITDAAGQSVTQGNFSSTFNDEKTITYSLEGPLDDGMTFTVELLIGQETITVPIDLKDIPLP